jgi:hypothetical protein
VAIRLKSGVFSEKAEFGRFKTVTKPEQIIERIPLRAERVWLAPFFALGSQTLSTVFKCSAPRLVAAT